MARVYGAISVNVEEMERNELSIVQQCSVNKPVTSLPSVLSHCLVGVRKSIQSVKSWVTMCWRGYLSWAKCKWSTYGPADATATPSSLASLKSRMVLPFWCRLTQVVLEKRPLNWCLSIGHSAVLALQLHFVFHVYCALQKLLHIRPILSLSTYYNCCGPVAIIVQFLSLITVLTESRHFCGLPGGNTVKEFPLRRGSPKSMVA